MEIFKITLACSFGASTSTIVQKMKECAAENGIEAQIQAIPTTEAIKKISEYSIVMLAPQVRYELKRFKKEASKFGVPILAIPNELYGDTDGRSILALALKEIMSQ